MPFHFVADGDITIDPAEALVNPVNCKGQSGKGLAAAFKKHYPKEEEDYISYCVAGAMKPGVVIPVQRENINKYVVYFPTKDNWRYR